MEMFVERLKRFAPAFPRRRYNIFSGTNTWGEWRAMLLQFIAGQPIDDEELITRYQSAFAETVDATHAFSFGAGRMALYAILEAFDIGPGDEVIVPAFTCVVVPNAILYRGARPVYVDIEATSFNMNPGALEMSINGRTRAIIAQHTFGVACDLESIKEIASRHNVPVIEDCAHALGARYGGKIVGALADVGFFTTDHSKMANTVFGGMVTTNNDALAARVDRIQRRTPFLSMSQHKRLLLTFLVEYPLYASSMLWLGRSIVPALSKARLLFAWHDELCLTKPNRYPYPTRLSSQQAALGLSQLGSLQNNLDHRRRMARTLEHRLHWNAMDDDQLNEGSWLRYSFLVHDRLEFERRFARHFDLGTWFTSIAHGRDDKLESIGYSQGSCPTAEFVAKHIVNLPTHLRIPVETVEAEVLKHLHWLESQIITGHEREIAVAR